MSRIKKKGTLLCSLTWQNKDTKQNKNWLNCFLPNLEKNESKYGGGGDILSDKDSQTPWHSHKQTHTGRLPFGKYFENNFDSEAVSLFEARDRIDLKIDMGYGGQINRQTSMWLKRLRQIDRYTYRHIDR